MIVRAVVSVRVDGVLLQRYPLVRRLDTPSLDATRSTVVPATTQSTIIPNTLAKRVRAVRAHEPITLDFTGGTTNLPLQNGLFMVFDENFLGDVLATNALATPATVDAYYAA